MTDSTIAARDHVGARDLSSLLEFASRALDERFPLNAVWHPGDLVWQLKDALDARLDMRIWEDDGDIIAVAWFVGAGAVQIEARPRWENLVADALTWSEAALATRRPHLGDRHLSVRALESDTSRIRMIEAHGYHRAAPEGVQFRRDLAMGPIPAPSLPQGFRIVDSLGIDPEVRAACHRDAWNHLDHLGIQAISTFTADTYRRLVAAPVYDPTLDLMIQAPDGQMACNTILWADMASGVGTFEPVGTRAGFRGLGLARAITQEGCRRAQTRGLRWARVSTAHFNAPAIATYQSSGFTLIDHSHWWTRRRV